MLKMRKRDEPEIFAQILSAENTIWNAQGIMGEIPIGKIAREIYPEILK